MTRAGRLAAFLPLVMACSPTPPAAPTPAPQTPAPEAARPEEDSPAVTALRLATAEIDASSVLEALAQVRAAEDRDALPELLTGIERLLEDPGLDPRGELRIAFLETVGALRSPDALPMLARVLGADAKAHPAEVFRAAVDAAGTIGVADETLVDALLLVPLRIPDVPSTRNIFERVRLAMVRLGEPAVGAVIAMAEGKNPRINTQAASVGVDVAIVQQMAIGILSAMGSTTATPTVLAMFPTEGCDAAGDDYEVLARRAFAANALGMIGDAQAVPALCRCRHGDQPAAAWEVANALGRIGGPAATTCLIDVMKTAKYADDAVTSPDFRYELRWEAARLAILAGAPPDVSRLRKAMQRAKPKRVRTEMEAFEPGLAVLERCGSETACYARTVSDDGEHWFAREVAATQLARASPKDPNAAETIAAAFSTPNPDARVTFAMLARRTAADQPCPRCADSLEDVMERERGKVGAEMQLAWITARWSAAHLRR